MLRFISSLFSPAEGSALSDERQALILAATERAIDGSDSRLRALSGYQKLLRPPIEKVVDHVVALVDALPDPIELSAASFGADPRIRALFCSVEHLRETLGQMLELRAFVDSHRGENVYALMMVHKSERSVFGMELEGDALRRDVLQTAVSFTGHRCIGPAVTEADTRWELKKRGFDYLVAKALTRLIDAKRGKCELDRQRMLLQQKLDAMIAGNWGLDSTMAREASPALDRAGLESQIDAIEIELGLCRGQNLSLEDSLSCIAEVFDNPASWLDQRLITLALDHRGILLPIVEGNEERHLQYTELYSQYDQPQIILMVRIPQAEIPSRGDIFSKASYYLN